CASGDFHHFGNPMPGAIKRVDPFGTKNARAMERVRNQIQNTLQPLLARGDKAFGFWTTSGYSSEFTHVILNIGDRMGRHREHLRSAWQRTEGPNDLVAGGGANLA